jgi:hypothetical protein
MYCLSRSERSCSEELCARSGQRGEATVPTGFEIHHLADVWNDEEIIPPLDLRFEIEGTELQDVTLREVLRWAYEQFVAKREERAQIEYALSAPQQVAVREKREDG